MTTEVTTVHSLLPVPVPVTISGDPRAVRILGILQFVTGVSLVISYSIAYGNDLTPTIGLGFYLGWMNLFIGPIVYFVAKYMVKGDPTLVSFLLIKCTILCGICFLGALLILVMKSDQEHPYGNPCAAKTCGSWSWCYSGGTTAAPEDRSTTPECVRYSQLRAAWLGMNTTFLVLGLIVTLGATIASVVYQCRIKKA
ncbi:uncharacterized protein LOC129594128 [Paramacrobiotus metropolitanus]|uniref:uncharacterized protein LOC129594128 n=1 Tax=Paramacrobiotus metropolitanus TaxID=2943436 RepID=UPI00244606EE|nr:uncharacterized protein LOC129594128 [Paramacrobiotus metropolitanus]